MPQQARAFIHIRIKMIFISNYKPYFLLIDSSISFSSFR
jgi:hypothetical protein